MLSRSTILIPSARTPEVHKVGVTIAEPTPLGRDSGWVHGALAVPAGECLPDQAEPWLRSLFVTVITAAHQVPQVGSLIGRRTLLEARRREASLPDGSAVILFPFIVDLAAALPFPLHPEAYFVHVSARHHVSEVEPLRPGDPSPLGPPDAPVDHLVEAYTLVRAQDPAGAARAFAAALADDEIRRDLDGAHLYNGACALSRAASTEAALSWLREDVERRSARRASLAQELAAATTDPVRPQIAARIAALDGQRAHARREDPDFAPLRGAREFEQIFE